MDARPQFGLRGVQTGSKGYVVFYPFAFEREGAEKFLYFIVCRKALFGTDW